MNLQSNVPVRSPDGMTDHIHLQFAHACRQLGGEHVALCHEQTADLSHDGLCLEGFGQNGELLRRGSALHEGRQLLVRMSKRRAAELDAAEAMTTSCCFAKRAGFLFSSLSQRRS
jgi:hypothetical protein